MKNLMILVKMQLKEQLNFKRLDVKNVNLFHVLASTLGAVLKFALVTVLCGAFLLAANMLGLFSLTNTVPSTVISIVFSIMLLMSIISCVIGLTKSMYYARDNAVLLTLPALPVQVYLSKLIIFFIFELKRNLSFIVPLFIAYYFTHNYQIGAYPWMLFCIIWVSLFTVAVGALLSIPAMWIANFFRHHKSLQIGSIAITVAAAVFALFYGISLIPENIDLLATWQTTFWEIQDFLNAYAENFSALYDITRLMLGETKNLVTTFPILPTFLRFISLAGVTVLLLGLGLLIVQPLFYKMASTPFEYLKKPTKPKKNLAHSPLVSPIRNEMLITFKSTDRMFANVGIMISIPILIYFLNKIFLAMNTRALGDYMIVGFNILIVLLILLNANTYASSIYSRDGRSSYLMKTQPTSYYILIVAKLVPNTIFALLSLLATYFVILDTLPVDPTNIGLLAGAILATYFAHLLYSAEQDLMNPQTELYATVGSSESNPNESKATLSAFIISFVAALVVFLLLMEGSGSNVYLKFLLVALAAMAYRCFLFFRKIKLYYKEK